MEIDEILQKIDENIEFIKSLQIENQILLEYLKTIKEEETCK